MRKSNQEKLRVLLREYTDGLTVSQVANITSLKVNNINRSLKNMPDAYIDRWEIRNRGRPVIAVWCVVIPPENCPKPERKKNV
jgi:Fic family protein